MSKPEKKLDLSVIFDDLKPETARDILASLLEGDQQLWMTLAEDFMYPPSALIDLVKKADAKFPENTAAVTEQEKIMFLAGALPPSRRVVEIALFIANDPESLQTFQKHAKPILAAREKSVVDTLTAQFKAQGAKALDN